MNIHEKEDLFKEDSYSRDAENIFNVDNETKNDSSETGISEKYNSFWKVMIVDDEEDIHSVTHLALKGFSYKGKIVKFIDCYSAKETRSKLVEHRDVAVILLDVVMETPDAGLELVKHIREELKNPLVQIILRTGHPGYAPEREVIVSYDINDYKTKTELTSFKLFTLLLASLRAYKTVKELDEYQNKLEKKVRDRTAEIENKNLQIMEMDQMKTRFFSNISHEFRTYLSLIVSPLEDILINEETKENVKTELERMYRNSRRLLDLVNQLMDLAKIDAGSMKIELSELDIMNQMKNLLKGFCGFAEKKSIDYQIAIESDSYRALCDRDKVEKIIVNLVSNAFKYTPVNGIIKCFLKIHKSDSGNPDILDFSIEDSGPGISDDQLNKIFDRFYQVNDPGIMNSNGTGIGLSLVKELMDHLKAKLEVKSISGEGSIFRVKIPLGTCHLNENDYVIRKEGYRFCSFSNVLSELSETDQENIPEDDDNGKLVLLIADDNIEIRDHIKEIFKDEYKIIEAADGKKAFDLTVNNIPDLIITDYKMPQKDGLELCKSIRSDEKTSHIPIILLTAQNNDDNEILFFEEGADEYVTKPYQVKVLQARVRNLIRQRKALQEKFKQQPEIETSEISVRSYDQRFMEKIVAIIEKNMSNFNFDVTYLYNELAMSRTQLFRKLKALTGQSPSEFIRTIRLKRASQLLQKGFGNVAEVTYEVGFNNLSYFAKCFREQFGVSPSEYQRKEMVSG